MNFLEYSVGDTVEAAVDNPERNEVLKRGDTGTVAAVRRNGVLVDWCVEPSSDFHTGDSSCRLPQRTGWWIYHKDNIRLLEEEVFPAPDEFDLSFLFGEVVPT